MLILMQKPPVENPYCHSDLKVTKNVFSADQLIYQKWKVDFSITKPCRYELVFNQERLS